MNTVNLKQFMTYERSQQTVITEILSHYNMLFNCYNFYGSLSTMARVLQKDIANTCHLLRDMEKQGIINLVKLPSSRMYVMTLTDETIDKLLIG